MSITSKLATAVSLVMPVLLAAPAAPAIAAWQPSKPIEFIANELLGCGLVFEDVLFRIAPKILTPPFEYEPY